MIRARRLGGLTALLAVTLIGSLATALPLFCGSLLGRHAGAVVVWCHVVFGSVFFAALVGKLVVLGRRARPARARHAFTTLIAHLGTALAAYTLITGVLVLIAELWSDQHLAAAFWMSTVVLAHANQYRTRALDLVATAWSDPGGATPHVEGSAAVSYEPARQPADGPSRLVVVGTGPAGQAVVEELVRGGRAPDWQVTMLGEEPGAPYDRVRLSHALAGRARDATLDLRPRAWFVEHDITLCTGCPVRAIDTERRIVVDDTGDRYRYDALVIATGSRPAIPPIEGIGLPHVVTFRTRRDVGRIAAAAGADRAAVVIGGGLLGLEAAAGLAALGMPVSVVEMADRMMPQQLDHGASRLLERALVQRGIMQRTGVGVAAITPAGVTLTGGEHLAAALVVVATGITPETALARRAGIHVAHGILVDDEMRTSEPGIWAVGECAAHRGTVYGLWSPLAEQARVAARVIAGIPARFDGAVTTTKLKIAGIDLLAGGRHSAGAGQHELLWIDRRRRAYRKLVLQDDRLVGALLLGDTTHAVMLTNALRERAVVPPGLLRPTTLASAPIARGDDVLCRCAAVTRDAVAQAIEAGDHRSVAAVTQATGAGGGCGSCAADIAALVAARTPVPA